MDHHHTHNHNHAHDLRGKKLLISILLNIGITVAQIIGGFVSGSLSLLSDALHNFTDVISLIVSYFAAKLSKKKASNNKTFGLLINALPIASICCSPPERVPPLCVFLSLNTGNKS